MFAIAVLTGCTATVGGVAVRDARTVAARNLVTILPTDAEVSDLVGNPLSDNGSRPVAGSIDVLPNGIRDNATANPIDCLGPVSPFMRIVYEKGDVRGAAWQEFSHYGGHQTVSSVDAGVVEFSSEAEAKRMFGEFVSSWKACEGTTVTTYLHNAESAELYEKINDVRVAGPILSATVINSDNQQDARFPTERAIGVAADCIVDVDVAVTDGPEPAQKPAGRAVGLVTAMLARVSRGR
ncbi:MAG: sensor domain-containing protein [Mycobacterium sp.]